MAGSAYEIELFGKKLIYSEGKLRDIKLHFFMDDLYELIKMQVGQLFDNAGDLNGLLYTTNEDITEIYVTMYDVTIQYIEKNVLKGIEAKLEERDLNKVLGKIFEEAYGSAEDGSTTLQKPFVLII